MKSEKINFFKEFLITQMNHWAFCPIFVMIVTLGYHAAIQDQAIWGVESPAPNKPSLLIWTLLGLIPLCLFATRRYIHKAFLFFLVHAGVIAVMFALPADQFFLRVVYVAISAIYVIYSLIIWSKSEKGEDKKLMPAFSGGICFAMIFVLHKLGYPEWDYSFAMILIGVIIAYFIVYYMEQYQRFLIVNSSSASHIPTAEMFRSGLGLVSVFSLLGLLVLILTANLTWMKGIVNIIKAALLQVLKFFLRLLPKGGGAEMTFDQNADMTMVEQMTGDMDFTGETFWLWNVLENIFTILMAIGLAALIVFALVKLFQFIRNKMKKRETTAQESTQEFVDVHEKLVLPKERKSLIPNLFERLEPAARIRQLYRKKLIASKNMLTGDSDVANLAFLTARESAGKLDRENLALTYEKARYSNEECTAEDVKHMREACK